jgi:hypothetical protein
MSQVAADLEFKPISKHSRRYTKLSPYEQSLDSWREVEREWLLTRQHWNDSTTRNFEKAFWEVLEGETKAHITALERLREVLTAAEQAVRR